MFNVFFQDFFCHRVIDFTFLIIKICWYYFIKFKKLCLLLFIILNYYNIVIHIVNYFYEQNFECQNIFQTDGCFAKQI